MLSGCATEALKNEQAETVITAGNKAVAANASFFKQYYASRENFLVNFYATNPDCALRPDYETIMENNTNKEFITLCPGIRPFGEDSGDQKRVADINFSKENLVDFIVVGRPIYKNENPNYRR